MIRFCFFVIIFVVLFQKMKYVALFCVNYRNTNSFFFFIKNLSENSAIGTVLLPHQLADTTSIGWMLIK